MEHFVHNGADFPCSGYKAGFQMPRSVSPQKPAAMHGHSGFVEDYTMTFEVKAAASETTLIQITRGGYVINLKAAPIAMESDRVRLSLAEPGLEPLSMWIPESEWEASTRINNPHSDRLPGAARQKARALITWLNQTIGAIDPGLCQALIQELALQRRQGASTESDSLANECRLQVRGQILACPAYPHPCSYVQVLDEEGNAVGYWDSAEWRDSPEDVMGAMIGLLNSPVTLHNPLRQISETEFLLEDEDPVWITVLAPTVAHADQANLSVNLRRTDDGVSVSLFPLNGEDGRSLASCFAEFPEATANQ